MSRQTVNNVVLCCNRITPQQIYDSSKDRIFDDLLNVKISPFCWMLIKNVHVLLLQILDSTERAVEHSLATTGRANARAVEVYSLTSKTTCFQWLMFFAMTCMFVMVVLLIRVTWGLTENVSDAHDCCCLNIDLHSLREMIDVVAFFCRLPVATWIYWVAAGDF